MSGRKGNQASNAVAYPGMGSTQQGTLATLDGTSVAHGRQTGNSSRPSTPSAQYEQVADQSVHDQRIAQTSNSGLQMELLRLFEAVGSEPGTLILKHVYKDKEECFTALGMLQDEHNRLEPMAPVERVYQLGQTNRVIAHTRVYLMAMHSLLDFLVEDVSLCIVENAEDSSKSLKARLTAYRQKNWLKNRLRVADTSNYKQVKTDLLIIGQMGDQIQYMLSHAKKCRNLDPSPKVQKIIEQRVKDMEQLVAPLKDAYNPIHVALHKVLGRVKVLEQNMLKTTGSPRVEGTATQKRTTSPAPGSPQPPPKRQSSSNAYRPQAPAPPRKSQSQPIPETPRLPQQLPAPPKEQQHLPAQFVAPSLVVPNRQVVAGPGKHKAGSPPPAPHPQKKANAKTTGGTGQPQSRSRTQPQRPKDRSQSPPETLMGNSAGPRVSSWPQPLAPQSTVVSSKFIDPRLLSNDQRLLSYTSYITDACPKCSVVHSPPCP